MHRQTFNPMTLACDEPAKAALYAYIDRFEQTAQLQAVGGVDGPDNVFAAAGEDRGGENVDATTVEVVRITRADGDQLPLSLDFVKCFPKLTSLTLNNWHADDFAPIGFGKGLRDLVIDGGNIRTVKGLGRLSKLSMLMISGTPLADIRDLVTLYGLQTLYLIENPALQNIADVSSLHNLKRVKIRGSGIRDLSGFSNSPSLKCLYAEQNAVETIANMKGMKALEGLYLDQNRVSSRFDLKEFPKITVLSLKRNALTVLPKGLESATLASLDFTGNLISSLDGAQTWNLPVLDILDLSWNRLADIAAIVHLQSLSFLSVEANQLTRIPDLSSMQRLNTVNSKHNPWHGPGTYPVIPGGDIDYVTHHSASYVGCPPDPH
jgi:internalin A